MGMPEKDNLKETGTRALFGAAGAAPGMASTGVAGFLGSLLNRILQQSKIKQVPGYDTSTIQGTMDLATKLINAGKYPSNRDLSIDVPVPAFMQGRAGGAAFMEGTAAAALKRGKALDRLMLNPNLSPSIIAHEAGHATAKSPLSKLVRSMSAASQRKSIMAIPSLLALTGAIQGENGELPTTAKIAPYVGAAQLASILGEESRANISGAKLLKDIGHKMPISKRLRMFVPTSTYLGLAGALVGAPLGIRKGMEYFNQAKERGAEPRPKQLLTSTPQNIAETPTVSELQEKWGPYFSE